LQPVRPLILGAFRLLDKHDDITVLVERKTFTESLRAALPKDFEIPPMLWNSMDFTSRVGIEDGGACYVSDKSCRVHAASAFGGKFYSVTLRDFEIADLVVPWAPGLPPASWPERYRRLEWPPHKEREKDLKKGFLVCQWHVGETIHDTLFDPTDPPARGLVLVTGATASGKTRLMNTVIGKYVCGLLEKGPKRRPHVVALGDPVETFLYQGQDKNKPLSLEQIGARLAAQDPTRAFDFTGRVLGLDSNSVADALRDALRETPVAYIISELRTESDFKAALNFAATGHLVFASAHSTSLIDAMTKLVEVFKADTPSLRAALAQRLNAVIHVRPIRLDREYTKGEKWSVALPTIWRSDSVAIRNFVSDGLASLLPRGRSEFSGGEDRSVLGLAHAAANVRKHPDVQSTNKQCNVDETLFDDLLRKAHERDLETR